MSTGNRADRALAAWLQMCPFNLSMGSEAWELGHAGDRTDIARLRNEMACSVCEVHYPTRDGQSTMFNAGFQATTCASEPSLDDTHAHLLMISVCTSARYGEVGQWPACRHASIQYRPARQAHVP